MKQKVVLVSVQFLVPVPDNVDDVESYGIDWLSAVVDYSYVIDYRHPKVAGVYLRPVPGLIDIEDEDPFNNFTQL